MDKRLGLIRIEVSRNHWANTEILSLLAEDVGVGARGCDLGCSTLAPTNSYANTESSADSHLGHYQ